MIMLRKMKYTLCLFLFCMLAQPLIAQDLPRRPLPLPQADAAPAPEQPKELSPAEQIEALKQAASKGDHDAAFVLGLSYITGNGVDQDADAAARYLQPQQMTPLRRCFIAEAYMETAFARHAELALQWTNAAASACTYVLQASWYLGNQLGPNRQKAAELLRKGLSQPDDGQQDAMRSQLGLLLLEGEKIEATPAERASWIGEAARQFVGMTEVQVMQSMEQHASTNFTPDDELRWYRRAAANHNATALISLGMAGMNRAAPELSYLEGMALYAMGARSGWGSAMREESEEAQLDAPQREELATGLALWRDVRAASGGYYERGNSLRADAGDVQDAGQNGEEFDHQLRAAWELEKQGKLADAEAAYRRIWFDAPPALWHLAAQKFVTSKQWNAAVEDETRAAHLGSRKACSDLAQLYSEGTGVQKNSLQAYLWLLRSETTDQKLLAEAKSKLDKAGFESVPQEQAEWLIAHQLYWKGDLAAAQKVIENSPLQRITAPVQMQPKTPLIELKQKADAGSADAAYEYVTRRLWQEGATSPTVNEIEHYAKLGAHTSEQKAHIADGYARGELFDAVTSRKYAEAWYLAMNNTQGSYELGELFMGKSDGIVKSDDERKGAQYWIQAVNFGDERWARLARMKLGYCVVKGWTSGDRARDAAWAHELAMEMLGKEFYQVAGEYSYGSELEHNEQTYLQLAERAAIYNIDNAQAAVATAIVDGNWKRRSDLDAYAWWKLRSIKQNVGDDKQVALAEKNPEFKKDLAAHYALLLKARAESGAFYPQNDPLRTATIAELEPRVAADDPEAEIRLGRLLEQQKTTASLERAIQLYHELWLHSGEKVRLLLGTDLMQGTNGFSVDNKGAEKWLWDAADYGSHHACLLLGIMHLEGGGVAIDRGEAAAWFALSGEKAQAELILTPAEELVKQHKIAEWHTRHNDWRP